MPSPLTLSTAYLDVPGARLYYEVRGDGPLVVLVAAPMDADSFAPLADLLAADHTVLTTDPRGINRSTVADRDRDSTPELRADDLARLIRHVDRGPAVAFGSSGGAVSVLALAQGYPELVTAVIAHEPPMNELLPDRAEIRAKTEEIIAAHLAGDVLGAWRKFLQLANIQMPDDVVAQVFGGERTPQQAADEDYQYTRMLRPTTHWVPDVDLLRRQGTRIVIGIGETSGGELCERTSLALGAALDIEPTYFPGGHIGFADDPTTFEPRFREVLTRSR